MTSRTDRLAPGPPLPPILQTLHWLTRPLPFLEACRRRYGDVFELEIPGVAKGRYVFFSDPRAIKQVFAAPDDVLLAGANNDFMLPLVGPHSLLILDGAEYRRQRRLVMPPFRGDHLEAHGEAIRAIVEQAIARWPVGGTLSLHEELREIGLRVIMRAVLGIEPGGDGSRLAGLLGALLDASFSPAVLLPFFQRPIPGSPWMRVQRLKAEVDAALFAEIRRRRAAAGEDRDDVLSLLLQARGEGGESMTDRELRDQLITLLVAGHETTAGMLAWTFECLLTHPESARRLDDELRTLGHEPTADAVVRLPFLDAVVKETLRLKPIFPALGRTVRAPIEIDGHRIPAGVNVAVCPYLVQRNRDIYPHPERFMPERFVGTPVDHAAWIPFGGGARRCLGMGFSLHQMKLVVATVWSGARLELNGGRPLRPTRRGIGLVPAGGTRVTVGAALKRSC
jgi:unspecific monooxygenase